MIHRQCPDTAASTATAASQPTVLSPLPSPHAPAGYAAPDYGNVNHSAASYGAAYGDAMQTTPSPRTSTLGATPMAVDTPSPMPAVTTAAPPAEQQLDSVQRCHMHTKPDLNCKFCRKYKSAVHELSRLAAQRSSSQPAEKPNQLPMTNSSTYNLNTLLLNNILSSEYYKSLAYVALASA
ncbi:PRP38 family protein [Babesia caballi]|uniref:PRP38 family protein n=1 Tax=Babesia caballi TaxID=5871 RepID=A0AAV4LMC8_BABCB|nr:PRP38 family protein [Babesia caballi]